MIEHARQTQRHHVEEAADQQPQQAGGDYHHRRIRDQIAEHACLAFFFRATTAAG
jgi:hypothetical protein